VKKNAGRAVKNREMGDDDDGSAALAAMRERLAALTQPAAGGMGQALEVAAMQDALATKLAASQARIDALMAGPSESDPPPAADDEVLEWQRKIAALSGTPTLAPPPAPAAPPPAAPGAAELKAAAEGARALSAAADADAEYWRSKIAQLAAPPVEDARPPPAAIAEHHNASLIEAAAADDDAGGGCCGCWPFGKRKPKDPAREIYSL
jgi:hypothetical protein